MTHHLQANIGLVQVAKSTIEGAGKGVFNIQEKNGLFDSISVTNDPSGKCEYSKRPLSGNDGYSGLAEAIAGKKWRF